MNKFNILNAIGNLVNDVVCEANYITANISADVAITAAKAEMKLDSVKNRIEKKG